LKQSILFNVCGKCIKLDTLHEREQLCRRMWLESCHAVQIVMIGVALASQFDNPSDGGDRNVTSLAGAGLPFLVQLDMMDEIPGRRTKCPKAKTPRG
jgi:hypothetical protein